MLTELRRRMNEHSETYKKYKKILNRCHRVEEYNNWTEKYPTGFKSRLDEVEEQNSNLEDRPAELTQTEQQKETGILKSEDTQETYKTTSRKITFTLWRPGGTHGGKEQKNKRERKGQKTYL